MHLSQVKKLKKLPNFPKRSINLFSGYKFGNKYFSENPEKSLVLTTTKHPESKGSDFLQVKLTIFSSAFSRDAFNRDVIRLHSEIFRLLHVSMKVRPVCFELFFDEKERAIKSKFNFLNFDYMTQESVVGEAIPNDEFDTLSNKIKSRILNFRSLSLTKIHSKVDLIPANEVSKDSRVFATESAEASYELISLLADPDYRMAVSRSLKGLPIVKARKLRSSFNRLIKVIGDDSVRPIELPKKFD